MASVAATASNSRSLRRIVLRADAAFGGLGGLALIVGARPMASFLEVEGTAAFVGLGAVGPLYAGALLWLAQRDPVPAVAVRTVAILNAVWVTGSIAVLTLDRPALSDGGRLAVAELTVIVAMLTATQFYAARRGGR